MKALYSWVKVVSLIVLMGGTVTACETVYRPTLQQPAYYVMTPVASQQAVFTPVRQSTVYSGGMSVNQNVCCATRAAVWSKTYSTGYYKVGSYPSYQYYNSAMMPVHGQYYYKTAPR